MLFVIINISKGDLYMKKKKQTEDLDEEVVVPKKKAKSSPVRFLIGLVVIALIGVMSYSVYKEIMVTLKLQKDIAEVSGEITTLSNQRDSLQKQADNLNDPAYIEQYARGKYKLTKEGETIYKLPGKTTTDAEEGN